MASLSIILDERAVNEYLEARGLEDGFVRIEAALLQYEGTVSGLPCVMLVIELRDGSRVLAKSKLEMLEAAVRAMRATCDRLDGERAGQKEN